MIIRKPSRIELKPEDDLYEYEEYKRKQNESSRAQRQQMKFNYDKFFPNEQGLLDNLGLFNQAGNTEQLKREMRFTGTSPNINTIGQQQQQQQQQLIDSQDNSQQSFPSIGNARISNDQDFGQLFSILLNNLNQTDSAFGGTQLPTGIHQPGSNSSNNFNFNPYQRNDNH